MPRLSGSIRVQSGRGGTESPQTSEKTFSLQCPCRHIFLRVHGSSRVQQAFSKKLSPVSMRGNSQNGGQTTKSLLTSRNVQGFQYSRQCRFPPPFHDTACFLLSPFRHRCAMSAPLRGHPIGKIKFPALSEAVSSEKTSPGRGKMARPERGTGSAKCQKGSKVTKNKHPPAELVVFHMRA